MVSDTIAMAGAFGFLVVFIVPMLYLTWVSYRDDTHSAAALREDDPDAESA